MAADNGAVVEDFDTDPGMAVVVYSETFVERWMELAGGSRLVLVLALVALWGHPRPSLVVVGRRKRQGERQTGLLELGHPVVD